MRTREVVPLKPPDVDNDLHRFTTTHHYETPITRKFSSHPNSVFFLLFTFSLLFFSSSMCVLYCIFHFYFIYSPHSTSGQHQHQPVYINKRMILSTKRQTPAGSVVKTLFFSCSYLRLIIIKLTGWKILFFFFLLYFSIITLVFNTGRQYLRHPADSDFFFLFFLLFLF